MFRYLVRRILWAILLFLVITFVTFVIFFIGPSDPARAQCGGDQATRGCLKLVTAKLGLDKPLTTQYAKFINRLTPISFYDENAKKWRATPLFKKPTLGTQYASGASLDDTIKQAAPVTASLVLGGAVLWM